MIRRFRLAFPLALTILLADCTTKEMAVERLSPERVPHDVLGGLVRLTLAYNDQAALSTNVGPHARWTLALTSTVIILVLLHLLWTTPAESVARRVSLGLILGGAVGNLLSRLTTPRGVVDFIDLGVGEWRFFICNVADIGVTAGACLFAYVIWREARDARDVDPGPAPSTSS